MINVSCKSLIKEQPFITVTILSCLLCTECHIGHLIVVINTSDIFRKIVFKVVKTEIGRHSVN